MGSWYKITFSEDESCDGRPQKFEKECKETFELFDNPSGAALLSEPYLGGSVYFLTPESEKYANDIIAAYKGREAPQPDQSAVLVCGKMH